MFHLVFKTLNSPQLDTYRLSIFHLGLWRKLEFCRILLTSQIIDFFFSCQNLDRSKIPKMLLLLVYLCIHSHVCPQLQASFFPPGSQSKIFRVLGILVLLTILWVSWGWLLRVENCHELFFNMEPSRFSILDIPITTSLMSWILPSRSPSTTFSLKSVFLNQLLFGQSFISRPDGKYHSATAPLGIVCFRGVSFAKDFS